MTTIENLKINPISLLNEISTKIKKKVDYIMLETPIGKIRVFECNCKLDKEVIGTGKGNSKQAAKNEAAKEGVRTLLSKESYVPERAAIVLSVQKTSGQIAQGIYPPQSPIESPSLGPSTRDFLGTMSNPGVIGPKSIFKEGSPSEFNPVKNPNLDQSQLSNDSDSHMNDSPLYELNVIAKECFIEPVWNVTNSPNRDGDFEAELKFDKLTAHGKGRKKQDAKREAAANVILQIRSSPQLKEKYNPKQSAKGKAPLRSGS